MQLIKTFVVYKKVDNQFIKIVLSMNKIIKFYCRLLVGMTIYLVQDKKWQLHAKPLDKCEVFRYHIMLYAVNKTLPFPTFYSKLNSVQCALASFNVKVHLMQVPDQRPGSFHPNSLQDLS